MSFYEVVLTYWTSEVSFYDVCFPMLESRSFVLRRVFDLLELRDVILRCVFNTFHRNVVMLYNHFAPDFEGRRSKHTCFVRPGNPGEPTGRPTAGTSFLSYRSQNPIY